MARAMLFGTPISPGIAIGPSRILRSKIFLDMREIDVSEIPSEQEALQRAALHVQDTLEKIIVNLPQDLEEYREIIAAQMAMAKDTKLLHASLARIEHNAICASWALSQTIDELCSVFQNMEDAYLRERIQDIRSVGMRMQRFLLHQDVAPLHRFLPSGIILAEDVAPADVIECNLSELQGIITEQGGVTSHTAILARGQRIPALAGMHGLLASAREGELAIVNGLEGYLLLGPDEEDLKFHTQKQQQYTIFVQNAWEEAHLPAETRDGVSLNIGINLESSGEIDGLSMGEADGIGLYRTEFAFLGDFLPTEEKLLHEYSQVAIKADKRPVVLRTLDVGADKMLRLQNAHKETNPALGMRGIRFCLGHPSLFRMQLRAILRAAVHGNVAILLPLIANIEELVATRRMLQELDRELSIAGIPHASNVPLGVMIETPAAALTTDILAAQCDFFSIGTNDLIHYLLAIDRNNRNVGYLYDPAHPAVLKSIKCIIDAAHREGKSVSVCGELASDLYGLVLLLGMGIDGLSVAPLFVPTLKKAIRQFSYADCMTLANNAMRSSDSKACYQMIHEYLLQVLGPTLSLHNAGHNRSQLQ